MLGAPVIVRHNGIFGIAGEVMTGAEIIGTVERFVAIYSSRIGDDAIGFPIGTAWRAAVLDDILSFELAGEHPYPFA